MPFKGEKIIYYATCSSTNTVAMDLASAGQVPAGTVVITDCQLQGRGQRGNSWVSEPYQNLTFSLILYPTWLSARDSFHLNIATALGIHQTLATWVTQGLSIKWPNDIYFQDQKIGGILIESIVSKDKLKACVIGIGLNVNQTNFNNFPHATSLALICGYKFNLSSLLMQLTSNRPLSELSILSHCESAKQVWQSGKEGNCEQPECHGEAAKQPWQSHDIITGPDGVAGNNFCHHDCEQFSDAPVAAVATLLRNDRQKTILGKRSNIQAQYDRLYQGKIDELRQNYLQHLYGIGKVKTFRDQAGIFQGVIQGVDEQGRLVVDRAQQGCKHYNNQEIALVL